MVKKRNKHWCVYIPNILTIMRIAMIPPTAVLFVAGNRLAALTCFLVAGLSDLLDGFLARRWDAISNIGKILDPFADKLMIITVFICLFKAGDIPLAVFTIALIKEFIMLAGGVFMLKRGVITPANVIGKIGTAFFTLAVVLAFLSAYTAPWYLYIMYIAVAFSLVSLAQYVFIAYKKLFKD